ncbi:MAG: hypothetical protein KY440_09350, partial [Actinobacteria bacterium]|nr:hypothetical protein [Actinomycetota bacterium]
MSRLHGTFNSSGTVTMSVASGAGSAKVSLTSPSGATVQLVVLDEAGGVLFTKAGMAFLAATVPVPSGTHRVVASGPAGASLLLIDEHPAVPGTSGSVVWKADTSSALENE